jgi:hypothetical protein
MDTVRPRTILRKDTDTFSLARRVIGFVSLKVVTDGRHGAPGGFGIAPPGHIRRAESRRRRQQGPLRVPEAPRGRTRRRSTGPDLPTAQRISGSLEQVPRDGVDQGNDEANHQPLHRAHPAQAFGKRRRQAEGRPADGLNSPHNTEYAEDNQTDQCDRVESEGPRNVAVEQCVTHPRPAAQWAIPTSQKTERTGQPEPGRCVQRAESEPACKKDANVSGCASGRK